MSGEMNFCANFVLSEQERATAAKRRDDSLFTHHELRNYVERKPFDYRCDAGQISGPMEDVYEACKWCGYRPDKEYKSDDRGRLKMNPQNSILENGE